MKKHCYLLSVLILMVTLNAFSQTSPPERISYQGIARDATGATISNQPIGIKLNIHQGSPAGSVVFSEQHSVTTNSLGLFTIQIGSIDSLLFQSIPWNNGPYYLEVLMDPTGGTNYVSIGTPQQILSVPYALYSKSSYSSAVSVISHSTINTPTIGITTNTSTTNATLTITQGANTASTVINFPPPPPANINIISSGIANVTPSSGTNFTVDVPPPNLNIVSGSSDATITITQGTATSAQTLVFPSNSHTITGTGIAAVTPTSGNNFTVNVPTQTLSITGNGNNLPYSLTSTHGGTVTLPSLSISITPTVHNVFSSVGGYNHLISIASPTLLPASPSPTNIASITSTPSTLNYSINVPPPTLTLNTNILQITQGPATSTVNLSSLTPTNSWQLTGNAGTNPPTHFLGTTDSKDLIFKTNNIERMRIAGNGNIGIGTTSPLYPLHTVYSGTNSNVHYIDYTSTFTSGANSAIFTQATSTAGGNIFGGYFQVTGSNSSNVAAAVKAFNTASASGFNYGIEATSTGTTNTGTNIGGYFSASGGANNYAAIFDQGNVGIGNTSPGFKLDITNNTSNLGGLRINNNSGMALYIDNNSSGAGIYVSHNSSNNAITIQNFNSFGNNIWSVANSTNAINIDIEKGYLRYQPQGISVTYPKGGVMMNSNTNGDMIIANSPMPTIISGGLNTLTTTITSTTPTPLTGSFTFNKQYDNSVVEIDLMCSVTGSVLTAPADLLIWIGIDGLNTSSGSFYSSSVFRIYVNSILLFYDYVVIKCYFYGTAGSHTLMVYGKNNASGTINNLILDPGDNGGKIFIKEHF